MPQGSKSNVLNHLFSYANRCTDERSTNCDRLQICAHCAGVSSRNGSNSPRYQIRLYPS